MILLLVAAMLAQLADLLTYSPVREINPVVIALGPLAFAAKGAIIVGLTWVWVLRGLLVAPRDRTARRALTGLLAWATLLGCIGAASNVL